MLRVLESAVDDDVGLADQLGKWAYTAVMLNHHAPRLTRLAIAQAHVMAIKHFFEHLMIGELDADGDIAKTGCLECIERTAHARAKDEDAVLALVAGQSIDAFD